MVPCGLAIVCEPVRKGKHVNEQLRIMLSNAGNDALVLDLLDERYQSVKKELVLKRDATHAFTLDTRSVGGWYNFSLHTRGQRKKLFNENPIPG